MSNSRLKIAIVVHTFPRASETFILDHVTGLIDRGHDVTVFAHAPHPDAPCHADYDRYQLENICSYWPNAQHHGRFTTLLQLVREMPMVKSARLLMASARAHSQIIGRGMRLLSHAAAMRRSGMRFDIIHAHFGPQGEQMAWLKKYGLLEGTLIASLHGYDAVPAAAQGLHPYPVLGQCAQRIIATTDFMARQAHAIGFSAQQVVPVPIGVRTEQFHFRERSWDGIAPLQLLTVARLVEKKGIEHALRAVSRLRAEGLRLRYTIVGDGPLHGELTALAAALGITGEVIFTGAIPREKTLEHLEACHLFVFPSCTANNGDQEGQGMAGLEAQACGLPIVATRSGGIPQCVDEGRSGLLVAEKDDAALSNAIKSLAARRDEWPEMGRAGRQFVEARFGHQQHIDRIERIYAEALAECHQA